MATTNRKYIHFCISHLLCLHVDDLRFSMVVVVFTSPSWNVTSRWIVV